MGCAQSNTVAKNRLNDDEKETLKQVAFFSMLTPQELDMIGGYFQAHKFAAGAKIITIGQQVDGCLYVITGGYTRVTVPKDGVEQELCRQQPGDYFGEVSLVKPGNPTTAGVEAGEEGCTCLMLTMDKWKQIMDKPWLRMCKKRLKLTADHRVANYLRKMYFFSELNDSLLDTLGGTFTMEMRKSGDVVMHEGDDTDSGFYIVVAGELAVTSKGAEGSGEQDKAARPMTEGDYFGEIGLVEKIPRTATVTVTSETCLVLRLKKEVFDRFMNMISKEMRLAMAKEIKSRATHMISGEVSDLVDAANVGLAVDTKN